MNIYSHSKRMPVSVGILFVAIPLLAQNSADDSISSSSDSLQNSKDLQEVVVNGVRINGREKIGHLSISGAEINKRPALLGEHDLVKALQTTSGVVAGTEGFAGLYVRGGETDQNLYLIDGLPLLNVYHFGGLFSTFSTYSVEKVDFYKGTFPALYTGRASSIVDVALKQPDYYKTTGTASLGLISGQLYLSTPLRREYVALSVALRRTWLDVFSFPALAILNATKKDDGRKTLFHYNFTDLMVKLSATDRKNNEASLLLFYGKDNFKLGEERFDPSETKHTTQRDINRMSWGNWGAAVDYTLSTQVGTLRIQPFVSKAFASDEQENMRNADNGNILNAVTKMTPSVLQTGMKESFDFPITHGLEGEVGMQQTWYDYKVKDHFRNGLLSAYAELYWNIAGVVQGSAGIHAGRYLSNVSKHWNLDPRANLKINLPRESSISLGYSRVTQYAQQVSSNYIYLPSDAWLPTASYHAPLQCDIYSLGYFKKFRKGFSVKGEVWWKNMHNLAEYKPNTSLTSTSISWQDKVTYGKGWAYGVDLEAEGVYRNISWGVSYGLMWNWRKFADINAGERYPAKFDNRHKIDINVGWKINDRLELTGQWEYMTGNRTTLSLYNIATPDIPFPDAPFVNPLEPDGDRQDGIDWYDRRNNVRLPAFHRLNLNLSLKGRLSKRVTYQWDFGLYNAYCRMNPFSVVKNYQNLGWNNDGDFRRFKTLSLIPILPSVSYTINF